MDFSSIIGYIITPITGVVSWLAGTRSRHNSVYQELLATIATLTQQNRELHETIVGLQNEVAEVRRENAELKAGQEEMTRQLNALQNENQELKKLLTRKSKK